MKKLEQFKTIRLLFSFFLSNSLNGLFNRPILAKRSTKILLCGFFVGGYLVYFSYNMSELMKLTSIVSHVDTIIIEHSQRISFFSFLSSIITVAIIIFVTIDSTIALDKSSLFFIKTLPFKMKEIEIAYVLFKFTLMAALYSLFLFILTPAIQIITTAPLEYMFLSISQLLLFLFTITIIEIVRSILVRINGSTSKKTLFSIIAFQILLTIAITYYFFSLRYPIELHLAGLNWSIKMMISIYFFSMIFITPLALIILYKLVQTDQFVHVNQFIHIPFSEKTIVRNKKTWSMLAFPTLVMILIAIQNGVGGAISNIVLLTPFTGSLLIYYPDTTLRIRKLFHLYRISLLHDWFIQNGLIGIVSLPSVVLYFFDFAPPIIIPQTICVSIASLSLGFLFPKSEGTVNETVAIISLIFIIIIVSLVLKTELNGWILIALLSSIHLYILRRVRNEKT